MNPLTLAFAPDTALPRCAAADVLRDRVRVRRQLEQANLAFAAAVAAGRTEADLLRLAHDVALRQRHDRAARAAVREQNRQARRAAFLGVLLHGPRLAQG